jgi:hypothetical protein
LLKTPTKNVNLRRSDANSLEKLRVEKGELYHLTQLTNLLRETCTPTERRISI